MTFITCVSCLFYLIYCIFIFSFVYWEHTNTCTRIVHASGFFFFCLLICDITTSHHFLTSHIITTTAITITAITPSYQQMAAAVGAWDASHLEPYACFFFFYTSNYADDIFNHQNSSSSNGRGLRCIASWAPGMFSFFHPTLCWPLPQLAPSPLAPSPSQTRMTQWQPMTANESQRRPTMANKSQCRPMTANGGWWRPTAATSDQQRSTAATKGHQRPTAANKGPQQPMKAKTVTTSNYYLIVACTHIQYWAGYQ